VDPGSALVGLGLTALADLERRKLDAIERESEQRAKATSRRVEAAESRIEGVAGEVEDVRRTINEALKDRSDRADAALQETLAGTDDVVRRALALEFEDTWELINKARQQTIVGQRLFVKLTPGNGYLMIAPGNAAFTLKHTKSAQHSTSTRSPATTWSRGQDISDAVADLGKKCIPANRMWPEFSKDVHTGLSEAMNKLGALVVRAEVGDLDRGRFRGIVALLPGRWLLTARGLVDVSDGRTLTRQELERPDFQVDNNDQIAMQAASDYFRRR
jgi:hypothetical protein